MFSKLRFESREAVEDLSPGREPGVRRPSPPPSADGHPSPARAGEGKGERGCLNPSADGLSYVAPSELTYAANFSYRTLAGWGKTPRRDVAATLRRHRPNTCNASWRHKATATPVSRSLLGCNFPFPASGLRRLALALSTTCALLANSATLQAQGCAMCYNTAAAAKAAAIQALRSGILILLVPVALMFIGIFVMAFRSPERFNE